MADDIDDALGTILGFLGIKPSGSGDESKEKREKLDEKAFFKWVAEVAGVFFNENRLVRDKFVSHLSLAPDEREEWRRVDLVSIDPEADTYRVYSYHNVIAEAKLSDICDKMNDIGVCFSLSSRGFFRACH